MKLWTLCKECINPKLDECQRKMDRGECPVYNRIERGVK